MRDLPLTALRALAATYETGGVRPAGRLLGVAHSAVSRHLRELEALLDAPLFEPGRGSGRLVFTALGEALGQASSSALAELQAAMDAARESHRGNAVRIAATPSFAARWLLPRLNRLHDRHPAIEVSLIVDQQPRPPAEQGCDIAIRMGRRPSGPDTVLPLMDDRLYPVAHPDVARPVGRNREITDLSKVALMHDRDPSAAWSAWKEKHGPRDLNVRGGSRFTSSDLVLRAAEQGMGVALARHRLAADAVRIGALVRLLQPLEVHLPEAYWLIVNRKSACRSAVTSVVAWLHDEARAS